jgi:uncharacterized membrane protein
MNKKSKALFTITLLTLIFGIIITVAGLIHPSSSMYIGWAFLFISVVAGKFLKIPKKQKIDQTIPKEDPLLTLKMRLAKGEITKEEFDELSKRL